MTLADKMIFSSNLFYFFPFADKPKTQEENDEVNEYLDTNENIENNDKAEEEENQEEENREEENQEEENEEEENQEKKDPKIGEFWRVKPRQDFVVIESLELDIIGVKFFTKSPRGTENYSKDREPHFICSDDLDKRIDPPKILGKGSRTYYSFENSDDEDMDMA